MVNRLLTFIILALMTLCVQNAVASTPDCLLRAKAEVEKTQTNRRDYQTMMQPKISAAMSQEDFVFYLITLDELEASVEQAEKAYIELSEAIEREEDEQRAAMTPNERH